MTTALLAAIALRTLITQGEGKRVDLALIALSFNCPKDWVVTVDKKKNVKIVFPVPSGSTAATVEIFPTNFVGEKDQWQLIQAEFVRTSKRELVRQWEEEILGVPLLLTRANFLDGTTQRSTVNALLYNDSARKMWFRLTAAPEDFDSADYAWRTALQSLRTFSGAPLKAQVPGVKPDPKKQPEELPTRPPNVTQIDDPTKQPKKDQRHPFKSFELMIANRKVRLQFPDTCKIDQGPDGLLKLTIPGVANPLTLNVFSNLDSDPSERALFKASSETLARLPKVERRDELGPTPNLANAVLHSIWRRGSGADGSLTTLDAAISVDPFYALASWSVKGVSTQERQLVDAVLRELTLVAEP